MDLNNFFKKFEKNFKGKKKSSNILILVVVGLLFLICGSFFKDMSTMGKNKEPKPEEKNLQSTKEDKDKNYEEELQNRLKSTLEKIDGVGKVEVMINFESGEEKVPAVNVNNSTNKTVEKDTEGGVRNTTQENEGSNVVVTNNGDKTEPLIVKEYKPKIIGICIVAQGAEDSVTKLRISKAVVDLFNVPQYKVNVYPMKK